MKKIYVTKQQLEEVLGADFNYLSNSDNGIKTNSNGSEVFASSTIDNEELPKPTIGDKIGNSRAPRTYLGGHYVRTTLNCSKDDKKKLVTEVNSELKDNEYIIPDELYNILTSNLNSINSNSAQGAQRLKNLVNNRNVSYAEMYRLKGLFSKISKDSEEYRILGGKKMEQWVNNRLDTDMSISHNSKQLKKDMGMNNAFIKSHEKTHGNGKAHTTKNNITFSYTE